jgi:hypothetical protein
MLKGDMVQAVRSSRAMRLSGLTLGAAALAATGLLAGGNPSQGPDASATTSTAARTTASATASTAGTRHGALHGIRRYLRTRQGVAQVALFNQATGRTYLLSGGPDTQYTASIVKAGHIRRCSGKPGGRQPGPDDRVEQEHVGDGHGDDHLTGPGHQVRNGRGGEHFWGAEPGHLHNLSHAGRLEVQASLRSSPHPWVMTGPLPPRSLGRSPALRYRRCRALGGGGRRAW